MSENAQRQLTYTDYTVACICPMGVELAPVKAMLDHVHPDLASQRDVNTYVLGEIAGHNMVIAVLPEIGTSAAATVATQLLNDFPAIRFGLLVGIGGGVPDENDEGPDIRLGDVVISKPTSTFGGVVQYDLGKHLSGAGFQRIGSHNKPPQLLRSTVEKLAADHRLTGSKVPVYLSEMLLKYPVMVTDYSHQGVANDVLFSKDYPHLGGRTCRNCDKGRVIERDDRPSSDPQFHYGTIGSANTVVKDAILRDQLRQDMNLMCIEMEAAGLMDSFPCLVVRGICDYADSHKNKKWQPYAAAVAAAYMKELLFTIPPQQVLTVAQAKGITFAGSHRITDLDIVF